MLAALVARQEDAVAMAELARSKLRKKIPDLKRALRGHMMEHHRFMLEQLLDHLALLEEQLASFSSRSEEELRPFVDDELLRRLYARQLRHNRQLAILRKTNLSSVSRVESCVARVCQGCRDHGSGV